jgi:succinyl-CoA synthetase beta subunit
VDLFEYQARDLFESHQIPVLAGAVATTADEAFAAAEKIGGKVVVKAQVKVGGRGKAGGVKLAENSTDAKEKAKAILLKSKNPRDGWEDILWGIVNSKEFLLRQ